MRPRFARRPASVRCARARDTRVPGLVLAGNWTDTGWPATLEGAVLSGHAAAQRGAAHLSPAPRVARDARRGRSRAGGGRWPVSDAADRGAAARGGAIDLLGRARGLVHKTGMGPAARAAARARSARPASALLVLGFCGGLDEDSVPGEVVVAEEVLAATTKATPEEVACADAGTSRSALSARAARAPRARRVRLAPGTRRAARAAPRGGAIAVDMESVWLSAGARGRPFGVVRVVLDSPTHELLRVRAVGSALRAARALRRVAGALHEWAPGG